MFDGNSQFYENDITTHGNVGILTSAAPDNFTAMAGFLASHGQVIHSTFLENYQIEHRRDYCTFIPTHGHKINKHRIDYISSSPGITCVPESLAVDDSLALSHRVECDHRPLVCMVALKLSNGSAPQRRRVQNYDKDSFHDPVKAQHFEKLMSEMPPIEIDVDNSSHCYIVDKHIRESLETCFPV